MMEFNYFKPTSSYCDEKYLQMCLAENWIYYQLTDHRTFTNHQRYEQRDRITAWCLIAFGRAVGGIDSHTFEMNGSWFYALSRFTNYDDYIFFKNETESSLFVMQFANDIIQINDTSAHHV